MSKQEKMMRLANRIMRCEKCTRLRDETPFPYPHICMAEDWEKVELMCIGRNPGIEHSYEKVKEEEFMHKYHKNFMASRAGEYIVRKLGLKRMKEEVIWINICKCSSPHNSFLREDEVKNCEVYLKRQLNIMKPRIIITFGEDAFKFFYPKKTLKKNHAQLKTLGGYQVLLPLYHYAYFARTKDVKRNKKQNEALKCI